MSDAEMTQIERNIAVALSVPAHITAEDLGVPVGYDCGLCGGWHPWDFPPGACIGIPPSTF